MPGGGTIPLANAHKLSRDTMQPRLTRRTALKATGSLGVGIATGSILTTPAAAEDHTFAHQLDTVRSFTRQYRDVATAEADGYEFFGVLPPVGHIYANPGNIGNTGLTDPPSLLFYAPNNGEGHPDESDLILAGFEYHVAGDQSTDPPNIFDDESASRELQVTEEEGWHYSPIPDVLDVTGLHVWVHLQNPMGVFHRGHPTIERLVSG